MNHESTPRPQNLRQLLTALPQYREELLQLLAQEFPDFATSVKNEGFAEQAQAIPSEFYARVLETYATTSNEQLFWSISNLILQQALSQLDPYHMGMALIIAQCMPPSQGGKIRSLRERVGRGTSPWPFHVDEEVIFLGAESLAGYAVSNGHLMVIENAREQGVYPAHWAQWEKSAAAYPIKRMNAIAGCLLVSSAQVDYFQPSRQLLLGQYATLLLTAFTPEEFYSLHEIELQPMPFYQRQKLQITSFRQRLTRILLESQRSGHSISILDAEQIAWQQIEEELLQMPPYSDTESGSRQTIQQQEVMR